MPQLPLYVLAAGLTVLGVLVWRAKPESPINRWFAAYSVAVAAWVVAIAGLNGGRALEFWGRLAFASAAFIPGTFLQFTYHYPARSHWLPHRLLRLFLFAAFTIAVAALVTPWVVHDVRFTPLGLARETGPLYPAFVAYFACTWITAMIVFALKWRAARGLVRAQLQYLGVGIVLSMVGGIGANLVAPMITGHSTYSWVGPYFSLILVALVGHAIIRHRLMDLRVVIHRSLAQLVLIGVTACVVLGLGRALIDAWREEPVAGRYDQFAALLVLLVMLTKPVQYLLDHLVDSYLYRGRTNQRDALGVATHRLSELMEPERLAAELCDTLKRVFVPESVTILIRDASGNSLHPTVVENGAAADVLTAAGPVPELVRTSPHPCVVLVDPMTSPHHAREAHEALRAAGIEVLLVLGRRDDIIAVVGLGPRRSGDAYFATDVAFIESLAHLASISLDNAVLHRQRIQMLEYSERLLESLDSAVVAVDVNGTVTSVNSAAVRIFGIDRSAPHLSVASLPPELGWPLAVAFATPDTAHETELVVDAPAGGPVPVMVSTTVLHGEHHAVIGALAIATDITTVKALERNERRVEHLARMARVYAGLAHEIRNPLTSISNFVSMLSDRFDDPEFRDTAARVLPMEVSRIVRLSDRLRLMAPTEDGKLCPVALGPLLHDIVRLHSPSVEDRGIRVDVGSSEDLPMIEADPGQIIQLVINLFNNAVEAMPGGGAIVVRATARVSARGSPDTVVLELIDEGTGIDPSHRSKIFEPFFTTKAAGTGLGLSICDEIATFHRARLSVEPRCDRSGSIARVEFPTLASPAAGSLTRATADHERGRRPVLESR